MNIERSVTARLHAAASGASRTCASWALLFLAAVAPAGAEVETFDNSALHGVSAADGDSDGQPNAGEDAGVPRFNPRCDPVGSRNLIGNASFECGEDLWSSLGKPTGWGGDLSGLYGAVESGGAWHGTSCLRIDLGPGITPVTCFDVWPPACHVQHAPLAANIGWMTVTRGGPITLSAYLKSSIPGTKATFLFRFAKNALDRIQEASHGITLTTEWTRYTVTQTALDEDACVAIGPDMTAMPDTAASFWLDAVQLEAGSEATEFETREPVEVGITTGHYGNVYDHSEPVTLVVRGVNGSEEDVSLSLRLEMEDYFGGRLQQAILPVEIRAGGQVAVPWTVSVPGKGHYRANIAWPANGRAHARTLALTVIKPYPHDDSPFGLNHPATTDQQLGLLARAGIRWVRNWAVNWEWVEPAQGQISWTAQDRQIEHVSCSGMKTLVVFPNPSTSWASSAPAAVEKRLWYRLAYAPADPGLLFDFAGKAVNRYRKSCACWEFLNEPLWVPDFCLPENSGYKVADYINLLRGAYGAIKEADPDAKVIAGLAIEPRLPMGDDFITEGGLNYCDVLNLHPYGGRIAPEEFITHMERIQKAMDAAGQRKPIWATETAYYAVDDKPWTPWVAPPGHFSAALLLSNERTAADYIVRHAIIMLAHGTEKLFYHEPIEGPVNNGAMDIENTFLSENAVPRKSYAALAALANMLGPSPRPVGQLSTPGEERVYGYAFQCGGRALLAAWAAKQEGESKTFELAVPQGAEAFDVIGNPVRPGRLILSESPVYVQSSSLTAEALLAACAFQNIVP